MHALRATTFLWKWQDQRCDFLLIGWWLIWLFKLSQKNLHSVWRPFFPLFLNFTIWKKSSFLPLAGLDTSNSSSYFRFKCPTGQGSNFPPTERPFWSNSPPSWVRTSVKCPWVVREGGGLLKLRIDRCISSYSVILSELEPITRSLHTNCTLESTQSRIFLFLELRYVGGSLISRENTLTFA